MLSIISVPRATTGLFNVTQRNAIRSWRRSIPECEILLCGNEVGIESLADEVAGHVIKEIKVNDRGTPLLNSVLDEATRRASYPIVLYVNADVILMRDIGKAILTVSALRRSSL